MHQQAGHNLELTRLSFAELKLNMNATKTQGLLCGTIPLLSLLSDLPLMDTGGQFLELETVFMDLDVLLDSHMTFSAHADHIAQQMCGILCYLSRTRHFLTEEAPKLLHGADTGSHALSWTTALRSGTGKTKPWSTNCKGQ